MKDGLFFENDRLVYYRDGKLYHAGAINVDDAIYYINSQGYAVKGYHTVHPETCNNILKPGTYFFGDDYRLDIDASEPRKKTKEEIKAQNKKRLISLVACLVLLIAIILVVGELMQHAYTPPLPSETPDSAVAPENTAESESTTESESVAATESIAETESVAATESIVETESVAVTESIAETESVTEPIGIVLPDFSEEILLCSEDSKKEYDGEITMREAVQSGNPYRPFLFDYHLPDSSGILRLSEYPEMTDARTYVLPAESSSISIDNLKTDTAYYYKVLVDGETYTGSFRTAPSTRFVSIPGSENVRDIGGYVNKDGKKVKQGILIRGTELDGLVNTSYFLPDDAVDDVLNTFGFVYDLDLRGSYIYDGVYTSPFHISHQFYDAPSYAQIFQYAHWGTLHRIFTDLADPAKYPMYLHCTWGQDRTGTVIFLLQGILNMYEEDMIREYELSGYKNRSLIDNPDLELIISGLEPYAGETLNEKIISYLTVTIGLTDSQISSIRSIFLEA